MRIFGWVAATSAVVLSLAGCGPGNPLVGTWGSNAVSAADMSSGVTTSDISSTFRADNTFASTSERTYSPTMVIQNAGCTETVNTTGTYTLSGTNTIAMTATSVVTTRVNCVNPNRNVMNEAADTPALAAFNTFLAVLNTYSVSGTVLTISSTTDGGMNQGALVLMRRN